MSNQTITPSLGAGALAGTQITLTPLTNTAKLYLTEFESLNEYQVAGAGAQIAHCPPLVSQVVNFGATSTLSAPFGPTSRVLRVHTDTACCLCIGTSAAPVAVAGVSGVFRMAASQTEYFKVKPGDVLAVIVST